MRGDIAAIAAGLSEAEIEAATAPAFRSNGSCAHRIKIKERSGYQFCAHCGETIGRIWKRKIDDICDRNWGYRPHKTKPLHAKIEGEAK